MTAQAKRCLLKFSLRTLLIVVTIVSTTLGWVAWQRQIVQQRKAMRAQLEAEGAWFVRDVSWAILSVHGSRHSTRPRRENLRTIERQQTGQNSLPRVRRWFGDEYVEGICLTEDLASRRQEVARLFPESTVLPDPEDTSETLQRNEQLRVALLQQAEFELAPVPLQDALDFLKDLYSVDFQVDADGLKRANIDSEVKVNCTARDIPLGDALTQMLAPVGLTFVIREQMVTVTTEAGIVQLRKSVPGLFKIEK